MKKRILMSLFTIAIVGTLIGGGVAAVFTSSDSSNPASQFTAGTLIISLPDNPGSFSSGFDNMKPGDVVYFTINVQNDGNLPLQYDVSTTLTGGLITLGSNPCFVKWVRIDGNQRTHDTLSVYGGGDSVDTIKVAVEMPSKAGNIYQGKNGWLTVTVNATQQ